MAQIVLGLLTSPAMNRLLNSCLFEAAKKLQDKVKAFDYRTLLVSSYENLKLIM